MNSSKFNNSQPLEDLGELAAGARGEGTKPATAASIEVYYCGSARGLPSLARHLQIPLPNGMPTMCPVFSCDASSCARIHITTITSLLILTEKGPVRFQMHGSFR